MNLNFSTREVVKVIKMPVKSLASISWGGCDRDILFVSTSIPFWDIITGSVSNSYDADTEYNGMVFAVTGLGATGVLTNKVDLRF